MESNFVHAGYKAKGICRFLPDKAIDLVDEACSKLRLQQESKPEALESLDRQIMTIQIELESLRKETDSLSVDRRQKLEDDLKQKQEQSEKLTNRWQEERYKITFKYITTFYALTFDTVDKNWRISRELNRSLNKLVLIWKQVQRVEGAERWHFTPRLTFFLAQRNGNFQKASELRYGIIPNLEKKLPKERYQSF